jgi:hypothetical protein
MIDVARTRFAIEALVIAKDASLAIDEELLDTAVAYVSKWSAVAAQDKVEQQYIYSLLPDNQFDRKKVELNFKADPALLARAAIANNRQGFVNSTEEETALIELAKQTETQLGWKGPGEYANQPQDNWNTISYTTAWAALAVQDLGIKTLDVEKALDYLYRNDEYSVEQQANQLLATVKYYQDTDQVSPNYTYTVSTGNTVIAEGTVTSAQQVIKPVVINKELLTNGNAIKIEKTGTGELFSQLELKEFYSDPNLAAQTNNVTIDRKYLSTKKDGEPTEVGDLVIVQFTVTGLGLGETAIEIQDFLPSGLVAIDETLDNGNFDPNAATTTPAKQQILDQGMKLNFATLASNGTYSYKTRVISKGIFNTPPAMIRLVNEPMVWAHTKADTLKIDGKSSLETLGASNIFTTDTTSTSKNVLSVIAVVLLSLGAVAVIVARKYRDRIQSFIQKLKHVPPTQPPVLPPVAPPVQ